MFESFYDLLHALSVFNPWASQSGPIADRMNTIARKLMNAMFLVEQADTYPRASVADILGGVHEMRALDAYIDSAIGQLHGAADVLGAMLTVRVFDSIKRPLSFQQMYDKYGHLNENIADSVGPDSAALLEDLYCKFSTIVNENNDSKHNRLPDRVLIAPDYPDWLFEFSKGMVPYYSQARDVRADLQRIRHVVDSAGRGICKFVSAIAW